MQARLEDYARLGLVFHMIYADALDDPARHACKLRELVARDDIETLDCCLPYGDEYRKSLIPVVRDCGKEVVYALHLIPLRKLSLASPSPVDQAQARLLVADQIRMAAAVNASACVFASGLDLPDQRDAAKAAFREFSRWFCLELRAHGMRGLLEPFDRDVHKKYLYGPTEDCVALIESLQPEVDNVGIELDLAHLPLLGESFEHAFEVGAHYIERVHIGNCVIGDPAHTLYGDWHPPLGIEGGEIDVPELTDALHWAMETGFLSRKKRGALLLEILPPPDQPLETLIEDARRKLNEAWQAL